MPTEHAPRKRTTVTEIDTLADNPPGSVAVTVTLVLPLLTPAKLTVLPETETVVMAVFDDSAV